MKSYTNKKLRKKLQSKGIKLDEGKKKAFDKYSYYQVVNAYKNIFANGIENIDDIEQNILSGQDIERYKSNYSISHYLTEKQLIRQIKQRICEKYGISYKYSDTDEEITKRIKAIDYYNHLYSEKVIYSDFVRMYKFEHELRNILLKYTLIIEESLKNVFVVYLNSIEASADFLTDINQYETGQNNINNAIESIKKVFDKQTNKHSNPIKRKNKQNLSVPYWIIINELTLGETIKLIINLEEKHRTKILENCVNYFTKMELKYNSSFSSEEKENYYNHINAMRELLSIIGRFRNNLAHNQPIYNFNVKEYYSPKKNTINYALPKAKSKREQYILNAKYMSYFSNFFGSDKYNSFTGDANIDLSWIIYVIYKFITHLDQNTNMYTELTYVYQKFNIILTPKRVAINKYQLYEQLFDNIDDFYNTDFNIKDIIDSYDKGKPIKRKVQSLNKNINAVKSNLKKLIDDSLNNNDCMKYTHFLFDRNYTKYTGIDKKYFDKIK